MGIFSKSNKGENCQIDANGVQHCIITQADKNDGLIATGTEVSFSLSKETGCEPVFHDKYNIMEDDRDYVQRLIEAKRKSCKKGLV